jgi:hypothetical protein
MQWLIDATQRVQIKAPEMERTLKKLKVKLEIRRREIADEKEEQRQQQKAILTDTGVINDASAIDDESESLIETSYERCGKRNDRTNLPSNLICATFPNQRFVALEVFVLSQSGKTRSSEMTKRAYWSV